MKTSSVTALHRVVNPVVSHKRAVFEIRVFGSFSGTVVGLLNEPSGVSLIDDVFESRNLALIVLDVVYSAAPDKPDADLQRTVFEVVGVVRIHLYRFETYFADREFTVEISAAVTRLQRVQLFQSVLQHTLSVAGNETSERLVFAFFKEKNVLLTAGVLNVQFDRSRCVVTYLGKVVNDVDTPQRDGFAFAGWFKETTCVTPFDFNTDIKEDTTIYAKWVADSVTFYNVTFNTNYGEQPTKSVVQVAEGNSVSRPVDPSRANVTDPGHVAKDFTFRGWFTDEACTTLYDFNSEVIGDIELFAGWNGQYIFEAEHVDLVDANGDPLQGMGASGGSVGANMVDSPAPSAMGIDASNGYYVTYLYAPFLTITFNITSDRAVSDAKLTFRVTCEKMGYALSPTMNGGQTDNGTNISNYTINVNDEALIYDMVEVTYNAADYTATDGWRPFSDFVLTTSLNLKKGENKLDFISSNANGMGGTMAATAPVIDCLKIDTSAELSWDPVLGNEFGQ